MADNRQFITIYCDDPSHTPEPVGKLLLAPVGAPPQAALNRQIELKRRPGVFLVTMMWRFRNSENWLEDVRLVSGLARGNGGLQWVNDGGGQPSRRRYRLKCGSCPLRPTYNEPGFSNKLSDMAAAGVVAVSLRGLIDADTRTR
ncbi:hypothetical protein [Mycolicibacterium grossiae]|uniref:Uncharacterized protein n=1 Tax=Mycolicibacterium grossiae TaxID=1552759 RepID=A0A1E8QB99_9MYCO|nr:hypothetical protein [Mycolicibacterium grossiae]OFJ55314.1 hypothetical protein BEL07_02570 [Mycolicibacterium grossiae]QEM46298.1 hypothetical protein FZ046_17340 [Mycolicibacterium grossiae]